MFTAIQAYERLKIFATLCFVLNRSRSDVSVFVWHFSTSWSLISSGITLPLNFATLRITCIASTLPLCVRSQRTDSGRNGKNARMNAYGAEHRMNISFQSCTRKAVKVSMEFDTFQNCQYILLVIGRYRGPTISLSKINACKLPPGTLQPKRKRTHMKNQIFGENALRKFPSILHEEQMRSIVFRPYRSARPPTMGPSKGGSKSRFHACFSHKSRPKMPEIRVHTKFNQSRGISD